MNCLNLSLGITYNGKDTTVQEVWDDLSEQLGSKEAAYAILMHNNGYPLDMTSEGLPSNQYNSLIKLTGDKVLANQLKARTFASAFRKDFGEWIGDTEQLYDVDENGEPKVYESNGVFYYNDKEGKILAVFPGQDLTGVPKYLESKILRSDTIRKPVLQATEEQRAAITKELAEKANPSAKHHIPKEQFKTSQASQYIGQGSAKSSTAIYKEIYDKYHLANTGSYNEFDLVYVSSNGGRPGRVNPVSNNKLQGEYKNIDNAIEAGASFIMDTKPHIDKTASYNIGELALAEYLEKKRYKRDNATGIWKPTVKAQNLDTVSEKVVPSNSIGSFMVSNQLTGQTLGISSDTKETYKLILSKAASFGIVVRVDSTSTVPTLYRAIGTGGEVVVGQGFGRMTAENKALHLMHAALQGIFIREAQNLDTKSRETFKAAVASVVREYKTISTDIYFDISNLNTFIPMMMTDDKVISISKENPALWDAVYGVLSSLMPRYKTNGMKVVYDTPISDNVGKGEIKPIVPVVPSTQSSEDLFKSQFTPSTTTSLKVGSIVKYSDKKTFDIGYTRMMITSVDGRGMYSAIAIDPINLGKGVAHRVVQKPMDTFSKEGDFSLVEEYTNRITPIQVAVFNEVLILNITKLNEKTIPFINSETDADVERYTNMAKGFGDINSKSPIVDNSTPSSIMDIYNSLVEYPGEQYANISDAFEARTKGIEYASTINIDGTTIEEKFFILADIIHGVINHDPSLVKEWDFSSIQFDVSGANDYLQSNPLSNNFISALKLAVREPELFKKQPFRIEVNDIINQAIEMATIDKGIDRDMLKFYTLSIINKTTGKQEVTKADLGAVATIYGNSSNLDSATQMIASSLPTSDSEYAFEIVLVFTKMYISIYGEPKVPTEIKHEAPGVKQYAPDEVVTILIEDDTNLELELDKIKNAINSGVKTFIGLLEEDIDEHLVGSTKSITNYILNMGYTQRVAGDIMEYTKTEKKPVDIDKKSIVPTSEKISTELTFKGPNVAIKFLPENSTEVIRTTSNEMFINLYTIGANTLHRIISSNSKTIFKLSETSPRLIQLLRDMKHESNSYPDNLVLSPRVKAVLKLNENAGAVGTQINGKVIIKGITINLNDLGITFDLSEDQLRVLSNYADWLDSKSYKPFSIEGPAGTGKALANSELVLTPKGFVRNDSLKVGDLVIRYNGKPTLIEGVYPQGLRDIYRVTFFDGTYVDCDKEHIWRVKRDGKIEDVTVSHLLNSALLRDSVDLSYGTIQRIYNYSVPLPSPVEYEQNEELPIDPYTLGVLLGDGTFSKHSILVTLKNKHIPEIFLKSSIKDRIELLRGLLVTDGYDVSKNIIEYSTSSIQLKDNVLELLGSLGISYRCVSRISYYPDKDGGKVICPINYRIYINKTKKHKDIISIIKVREEEATCIKVDAEDSLYITRGFTVTHNTTLLRVAREYSIRKNRTTAFTATTNMAAINLEILIGARSQTIHSLIGLSPTVTVEDPYTILFPVEDAKFDLAPGSVIFIDEIGFATEKMTDALISGLTPLGIRLVYIGSEAQLANVEGPENKSIFNPNAVSFNKLTQIKRQSSSNPAMLLYSRLAIKQDTGYNFIPYVNPRAFYNSDKAEGAAMFFKQGAQAFLNHAIKTFNNDMATNNVMGTRILTYTNKKADEYNRKVRAGLNFTEGPIQLGEYLSLTDVTSDRKSRKGLSYKVIDIKVKSIKITPESYKTTSVYTVVLEPGINYTIDNEPGLKEISIDIIPDTHENRASSEEYVEYLKTLGDKINSNMSKDGIKKLTIEHLEQKHKYAFMFEVKSASVNKYGKKYTLGQAVNYGYASTVHKAQGSTFDRTYIDEDNARNIIQYYETKNGKIESYRQYNKFMYVAMTRAKKLSIILTGTLTPINPTTSQDEKGIKQKRQLEEDLVGVLESRRITMSTGDVVTETSPEHNVRRIYNVISETANDKIVHIASIKNRTPIEEALLEVAPNDILVNDDRVPALQAALYQLMSDIAIDDNDPRIFETTRGTDRNLYNRMVYDMYLNKVYRNLRNEFNNTQAVDNMKLVLEARGITVRKNIKNDINNMQKAVSNLRDPNNEQVISDKDRENRILVIEEQIRTKAAQLTLVEDRMNIDNLIDIARQDLDRVEKLLQQPTITRDDYIHARSTLLTWMHVGDFTNPKSNPFLDEVESMPGDAGFQPVFINFRNRATLAYQTLNEKGEKFVIDDINSNRKEAIGIKDMYSLRSNLNWFNKLFYSLAEVDNPIIAHVMRLINTANKKAEIKAISESKVLADSYSKLKADGISESLFWQVNKNGVPTGRLVSRYTYEYQTNRAKAKYNDTIYANFKKEHVFIDIESITDLDAYIAKIEIFFDPGEARAYVMEAKDKYDEFIKLRTNYYKVIENNANSEELKRKWNNEMNPALRIKDLKGVKSYKELQTSEHADRFVVMAPKRYSTKNAGTVRVNNKFYDNNYETIQTKESSRNFYKLAETITKRAKSNFNEDYMSDYALGAVKREWTDELYTTGVSRVTLNSVTDHITKSMTGGYESVESIDPITGLPKKDLKKGIETLEDLIYMEAKRLQAKKYNIDAKLNVIQKRELFEEASKNIMATDKADIFLALNNLNLASLTYSYKNAIEPSINMALHYAKSGMEGGKGRGLNARKVSSRDIQNAMEMTEYFVNKEFYDEGAPDETYKLPFDKRYTLEERKQKLELEEKIKIIKAIPDNKRTISQDRKLVAYTEAIDRLGGYITVGSLLNAMTSYVRVLSVGWGINTGVVNALQGQVSNIVMAAAGKYYDYSDLRRAYGIMLVPGSDDRKKFSNVVENYALLGDIMYNFGTSDKFTKNKNISGHVLDAIDPFMMTKVTERGNQGAVMIAMFLHAQVTNIKDKTTKPMWEALSIDGQLDPNYTFEGRTGNDAVSYYIQHITEMVTSIHGDYINPKIIQDIPLGRAFIMFKMWFFDPFIVRFGKHKYNQILEMETKGRYITLLESVINPMRAYRKFQDGTMEPVDVENFRTAIAEFGAILSIMLAQALAKWALCDKVGDQYECGKSQYAINTLKRLNTELQTYITPSGYTQFIDNPLSVARILKTMSRLDNDLMDIISSEDPNATPTQKFFENIGKETPLVRKIMTENNLLGEELPDYR